MTASVALARRSAQRRGRRPQVRQRARAHPLPQARAQEQQQPERGRAREVRETMAQVRAQTAARILAGLGADGERPATRAAVFGWLAFLDAAILDWIEHGDMRREELHGMLLGTFAGALMASGAGGALTAGASA